MKNIVTTLLVLVLGMVLMTAQTNAEGTSSSLTEGGTNTAVCGTAASGTTTGCAAAKGLSTKIENVVKTFTGLVGAFAVGMIVYGGFKYIMSQGDPKAAEGAKNVIWYSGIGLFIVLVAYIIFDLLVAAMK